MVYCFINSVLQGRCRPMLIETVSSCIFRFGFTFPGCGYFLIPGRLTFGGAWGEGEVETVDVLGWQNALLAFPGLRDEKPEEYSSSLFQSEQAGCIQGEESLRDAGEGTGRPTESASLHPDSPRVEPHLDNSRGKLYAFSCLMLTISGMLPCDKEWSFDYPGFLYS